MGNSFKSEKELKETIRENQRLLKKSIREIEKELTNLKKQEKKLEIDIKKMAKSNQMGPLRIMAKDLVRTRNYRTRFIVMKTHLNAVALKMQTIKSRHAMSSAMEGVTKALTAMNSKMDLPSLQRIMNDFMRENEKSELLQEASGDAMDDAMEEEGEDMQEDLIINQILDELGIGLREEVPEAPTGTKSLLKPQEAASEEEFKDETVTDLQSRFSDLQKK